MEKNANKKFKLEDKILGKGCFGVVHLGKSLVNDQFVALKQIPDGVIYNKVSLKNLENEIVIATNIESQNLVKTIDITTIANKKYIVNEFCNGGDLRRYINYYKTFDERMVQYCLKQILTGLTELHEKNIIHHDIKPENILIDLVIKNTNRDNENFQKVIENVMNITNKTTLVKKKTNNILNNNLNENKVPQDDEKEEKNVILDYFMSCLLKLSDFGLSKYKDSDDEQKLLSGSPLYMDPAVFEETAGKRIIESEKVDIWAIGVLAYELFTGERPFEPKIQTLNEMLKLLEKGFYKINITKQKQISKEFLSFINMCLQKRQGIRPTAEELLFSEFITKDVNNFNYIKVEDLKNVKFPNTLYTKMNGEILMNIYDNRAVNELFDIN